MRKCVFLALIWMFIHTAPAFAAGFVDNGDSSVTDTETGLMWQQTTAADEMTWEEAISYCESLTLAGYSDWRLPNRVELQSLLDYTRYDPAIDTMAFPDTKSAYYWSSTTFVYETTRAWRVRFYDGVVFMYNKPKTHYVRAVRGGQ